MVGDEPLVAADDPGEVADAGRRPSLERNRDGEPGRVAERLRAGRPQPQLLGARQALADALGLRQVEAEQVAGVGFARQTVDPTNIRTGIRMKLSEGAIGALTPRGIREDKEEPAPGGRLEIPRLWLVSRYR